MEWSAQYVAMRRMCARCFSEFRGVHALHLLWCQVDRFYVCRRCWEERCEVGHGGGAKNVAYRSSAILGLVVILTLAVLPIEAVIGYDIYTLTEWSIRALTPTGELPATGLVKVVGTIEAPGFIAFGGHEEDTDEGWVWRWNSTGEFFLNDGTGAVRVVMAGWWDVEPGPHAAPYAVHTPGTVYAVGEMAFVQGAVVQGSVPTIAVKILSTSSREPAPSLLMFFGASLFGVPLVASWILAGMGIRRRNASHHKATQWTPVQPLDAMNDRQDPDLPWRANRKGLTARGRIAVMMSVVAVSALISIVFLSYLPAASRLNEVLLALGLSFLGMLGFAVPILWVLYSATAPAALAVTEDGVYWWYTSPYDRALHDDFVAWNEIKTIERRSEGEGGTRWFLSQTNGEEEALSALTRENLKALVDAWHRWSGTEAPAPPRP